VAICVSKIDKLFSRKDLSGGAIVQQFYDDLRELDPNGDDYSIEIIDAFSSLMERYIPTIWNGWNVRQSVDQIFDGRFRFFPLTPVGLHSLGQDDLEHITQFPYRVLHPLLWLLQMNDLSTWL
jgi:hypothetical protein